MLYDYTEKKSNRDIIIALWQDFKKGISDPRLEVVLLLFGILLSLYVVVYSIYDSIKHHEEFLGFIYNLLASVLLIVQLAGVLFIFIFSLFFGYMIYEFLKIKLCRNKDLHQEQGIIDTHQEQGIIDLNQFLPPTAYRSFERKNSWRFYVALIPAVSLALSVLCGSFFLLIRLTNNIPEIGRRASHLFFAVFPD